jgi:hypothetical protein
MRFVKAVLVATLLMWAVPATAQSRAADNDIQRLQEQVYQTSNDIARLRADADTTDRFETELDELREEVIYLKVKARKGSSVTRAEYADVRDKLQALRSRVRGEGTRTGRDSWGTPGTPGGSVGGSTSGGTGSGTGSGSGSGSGTRPRDTTYPDDRPRTQRGDSAIPVGQEIDVRLTNQLSSDTAQVEERFEATTVVDLRSDNNVLIPAGSVVRGVVSSVNRASRTDRRGSLTVSFDQITVRGRSYPMRGLVTEAIESEGIRGEAGRIGAGSAIGGIIGGIIGGVKGALLGVLIGGGGTIAATEGKDVTLPPGTILRVRLDDPPALR